MYSARQGHSARCTNKLDPTSMSWTTREMLSKSEMKTSEFIVIDKIIKKSWE
jgi:hypothetical protein